jgi:hypothetical protein
MGKDCDVGVIALTASKTAMAAIASVRDATVGAAALFQSARSMVAFQLITVSEREICCVVKPAATLGNGPVPAGAVVIRRRSSKLSSDKRRTVDLTVPVVFVM